MKNLNEIRAHVRLRMRKCWGESIAMFMISAGGLAVALFGWYLTSDFIATIPDEQQPFSDPVIRIFSAFSILFLLWIIGTPYKYGSRWYRLQQVRGHSVHAKSIFSCYFSAKRMAQVYKISIAVTVRKMILGVPFLLLVGASLYLTTLIDRNAQGFLYNLAVVLLLLLTVLVVIVHTVLNMKYLAVPYLFALGHDRSASEIIAESVRYMKGKQAYMITLIRSLGLMLIPCILVFPMIFIVPYVKMIYTSAMNEIIENGFETDKTMDAKRGIRIDDGI